MSEVHATTTTRSSYLFCVGFEQVSSTFFHRCSVYSSCNPHALRVQLARSHQNLHRRLCCGLQRRSPAHAPLQRCPRSCAFATRSPVVSHMHTHVHDFECPRSSRHSFFGRVQSKVSRLVSAHRPVTFFPCTNSSRPLRSRACLSAGLALGMSSLVPSLRSLARSPPSVTSFLWPDKYLRQWSPE